MIISDEQLEALILKTNILDQKGLSDLLEFVKGSGTSLENALIEKSIVSDQNLGLMVADYLKFPFVILSNVVIPEEVFHLIPERIARKQRVISFARDKDGIKLAMADPRNVEIQEMIVKKTGEKVVPYYATERDIDNTFHLYKKDIQQTFENLLKEKIDGNQLASSDVPIAKIVDMLLEFAYEDKASDVHIEPEEKNSLVRFRIDGILHDMLYVPKALHDQIVTRIKVQSRLRTDEHLSAQDGKMRLKVADGFLDIRVSILPVVDGEKVVLRLLASNIKNITLVDLGMSKKDLETVTKAFSKSFGMILSTGPTGSGKSTSIYAILKILNTREKNITTIEDPVEYRIKGVNQIQANSKANLTFANGLRSILRQDPNVVFVGEIRDNETAGIAVNAALTGHLVLSTLHTNDAATTLPRLTDMKVEPFLVASTVNVIIAQRLIRKICELCKTSVTIPKTELTKNFSQDMVTKHFGNETEIRVYQGKGCKVCHMTGFAGRLGIFEVLEVSKEIRQLIAEKADSDVIAQKAISEGMSTMLDDGLDKVHNGITTLSEVLRVTKVESL